jgi:hypothetical protein
LLAVLAEVAQLVELGMIAGADDARLGGEGGRLVGDGALEEIADVREFVDFFVETAEKFAAAYGRRREEISQERELLQRFVESNEFAGRSEAQGDAAGEAFEIEDAAKLFANFATADGLLDELRDGLKARFDSVAIDQRAENPGTEKARAHAGDGHVESGEKRSREAAGGFLGEDGIEEFEIANGDRVEDHRIVLLVVADTIEVAEGF